MKDPYLIQRCRIHKVEFKSSMKTSEYFDLDYMVSAEFEYGAIPRFQRRFYNDIQDGVRFRIITVPVSPAHNLYAAVNETIAEYYKVTIFQLYHNEIRTKEPTYIRESVLAEKFCQVFCFWMDIINDAVIATDPDLIQRFFTTVKNSVHYMDSLEDR